MKQHWLAFEAQRFLIQPPSIFSCQASQTLTCWYVYIYKQYCSSATKSYLTKDCKVQHHLHRVQNPRRARQPSLIKLYCRSILHKQIIWSLGLEVSVLHIRRGCAKQRSEGETNTTQSQRRSRCTRINCIKVSPSALWFVQKRGFSSLKPVVLQGSTFPEYYSARNSNTFGTSKLHFLE